MTQIENAILEIKTSFIPFPPWLQALVCPVIDIDGARYKKYWGTHTFKVTSGKHTVRAWHRWFFFSQCHLSEITVDVPEDTTLQLHWSTPIMVMSPGEWSQL